MVVVGGLLWRVDARTWREPPFPGPDLDARRLAPGGSLDRSGDTGHIDDLVAAEAERLDGVAVANWNGRTPIPTRFERCMRSYLSAMTARMPRSSVPLAAQSREDRDPCSAPARTTSGTSSSA